MKMVWIGDLNSNKYINFDYNEFSSGIYRIVLYAPDGIQAVNTIINK
jgi:hypothetical protein